MSVESVSELLAAGRCLSCLTPRQLRRLEAQILAGGASPYPPTPPEPEPSPEAMTKAASWSERVIIAGGSPPSDETIRSVAFFIDELMTAGIWNKFIVLNIFAPDSIYAAITPLIAGPGYDPWVNINFTGSDLNVYGLKGNGSSKRLDTGIIPNTHFTYTDLSWMGMCDEVPIVYGGIDMGCYVTGNALQMLLCDGSVSTEFYRGSVVDIPYPSDRVWARQFHNGYICGTRLGGIRRMFFADRWTPHYKACEYADGSGSNGGTLTISAFARRTGVSTYDSYCARRLQMLGMASGFTESESSALYTAVRNLRDRFAGGAVDYADDWARRVVANGGAAPSSATITVVRNFLAQLNTAGLLNKIDSMCLFVPDNLTAALTPIWRKWGTDPWENTGFVSGDLSINGLTGGSGKRLNAMLNHIYGLRGGLNTSLVGYLYSVTSSGGTLFGHSTTAYQLNFVVGTPHNTIYWDAPYNGGGGRITLTSSVVQPGYWCGVRGSATDQRLYHARSTYAHNLLGSNSTNNPSTGSYADSYCVGRNDVGSPLNGTMSFAAFCQALNATESSNFYAAIQAARIALGGGYV